MFVKVCGITNQADALLAVALGADALGFVFAPSPRQISVIQARRVVERLPSGVLTFGVFRDELPARVVEAVHAVGLGGAQLHGAENREAVEYVSRRVGRVIKAVPAGKGIFNDAASFDSWALLVDNPEPGSGKVFDWALMDGIAPGRRLILAGGLTPANVANAIRMVDPFGVDVSSGVEASPGKKDPAALRAFIRNARAAASQVPVVPEDLKIFDVEGDRS